MARDLRLEQWVVSGNDWQDCCNVSTCIVYYSSRRPYFEGRLARRSAAHQETFVERHPILVSVFGSLKRVLMYCSYKGIYSRTHLSAAYKSSIGMGKGESIVDAHDDHVVRSNNSRASLVVHIRMADAETSGCGFR